MCVMGPNFIHKIYRVNHRMPKIYTQIRIILGFWLFLACQIHVMFKLQQRKTNKNLFN